MTQPVDSEAVVDRHPKGLTVLVPPMGLRGPAASFLWVAVALVALGGGGAVMLSVFLPPDQQPDAFVLPLGGVTLAVGGVAMAAVGFTLARRRVRLTVVDGSLMLEQVTPLRTRREDWAAGEVMAITVVRSDLEAGDYLWELSIEARHRRACTILVGRSRDELEWIASELRESLRNHQVRA